MKKMFTPAIAQFPAIKKYIIANTSRVFAIFLLLGFLFNVNVSYAQIITESFEEASWQAVPSTASGATTFTNVNVTSYNATGSASTYGTGSWFFNLAHRVTQLGTATTERTQTVRTGANAFHLTGGGAAYIITPVISNGISTISFYARTASTTGAVNIYMATNANLLTATNSSTRSATSTAATGWFNSVSSIVNSTAGYVQVGYTITGSNSSNPVFIKIQRNSSSITIDDIVITTPPTCATSPAITSVTASSPICSNSTTTLTANGVAGVNPVVTWFTATNGGGTNLGTGTTLPNSGPGTYFARVTGDCGNPVEASFTIQAKINPGIVSVTAPASSLCPSATQLLTANVVTGTGAQVNWFTATNGGGSQVGTNTSTITVGPGTYYARVTGDCTPAAEAFLTVNSLATPSILTENLPGDTYTQGDPADALDVTASGGGTIIYQWFRSVDQVTDTAADTKVGTNSNSYTPLTTAVGTLYYYVVVYGCSPPAISSVSGAIITDAPITPTIIPDETGFSGSFGNQPVNAASAPRSFLVNGSNLTEDIVVAAPAGFEVSLSSGSGYATSVPITPVSGTVSNVTVYVHFAPTAAISYPGNIQLTSAGAPQEDIAVNGTGIIPTISLGSGADMNFNVNGWATSTSQNTSITGTDLVGNITASVDAPFQVSTTGSGGWSTSVSYTPSSGSINGTLYVRYNPSSGTGDNTGVVTVSSSNATSQTINVTGKAAPVIVLFSGSTNQSVKAGIAIGNVVYTVTGGVVSASASPLPSGVTYNSGTNTISGTPGTEVTYPQVYNYTVTIVGPPGTSNATASGTITVTDPNIKKVAYMTTLATPTSQPLYNELVQHYEVTVWQTNSTGNINNTAAFTDAMVATNPDLIVLHESVPSAALSARRLGFYIGQVPILNTKAHMYGVAGWPAGAGNNGAAANQSVTVNAGFTTHPIFSGVAFSGNSVTMTNTSGVIRWVTGATTTNQRVIALNSAGTAGAISIMEDDVRLTGLNNKKYMLIALSAAAENLTANGLLVLKNAADHLMAQSIFATAGANGTISSPGETDVPTGGSKTYTITPNANYHIATVTVDGSPVALSDYTFSSVTSHHTIAVTFAGDARTLTYSAGANGSISGTTPQTVAYGSSGTTVTAVANTGYHFVSWSDGILTAARTDANVTTDITVTASFAINTYTLTYTAGANGTITGTTPQTVNHGASGTQVTATPNANYHFVSWSDGVLTASRTDANVTANLSVTASFAIDTHTLTYTAGANGTITGTSPQVVNHNASGTQVTATPNANYHFVSWSDGVLTASRTDANVTADINVTASFAINGPTAIVWQGADGASWNVPGNWDQGSVPDGSLNVVINSGSPVLDVNFTVPTGKSLTISGTGGLTVAPGNTLTVTGVADFGGKLVTFKSTAAGVGSLGQVASPVATHLLNATNVTVERFIPNSSGFRAWRLLSVPTFGSQTMKASWQEGNAALGNSKPGWGTQLTGPAGTGAGFDATTSAGSILRWNSGAWTNVSSTLGAISADPYKAYFVFVRGDRSKGVQGTNANTSSTTLETNGSLYAGDQTSQSVPPSSFALVGNPYASAINFTTLTRNNVDDAFYIWDAKLANGTGTGQYQTFSGTNYYTSVTGGSYGTAGVSSNTTIESGQAFLVRNSGGSAGNITMHENSKISGTNGNLGFRPATPASLVKLDTRLHKVSRNNEIVDGNAVVFDNAYAAEVDGHDALKMNNTGENFAVLTATKNLAVEGRPAVSAGDIISFKMWNMAQEAYQLEFIPANLATNGLTAELHDAYLHTSTPVSLEAVTVVGFTVDANTASSASDRFRIVFRPSTPLPVSFISISASRTRAGVQVGWKVAAERAIRNYEIERSTDGRNFALAGTVTATGNSAAAVSYRFTDAAAPSGIVFYRIRSVGAAGEIKYTASVKVMADDVKPGFAISPNPAEGGIVNLQFNNQAEGRYTVTLLSNAGQAIFTRAATHAGGNSTQVLDLPEGIARGTYQVEIIAPDKTRTTQSLFVSGK